MPKITVVVKIVPGMKITRIMINEVFKKNAEIAAPVSNTIECELSPVIQTEDYFEFTMDGVADIIAAGSKGSVNFKMNGKQVMKDDTEFTPKNGVIRVFLPKVMFPS